ncbi:aminomethyl-transferring glycine dehydrogenase subunit GcvPB [Staphylococcus hominis]|uniref:aminomethyl-transferring glycine dehydrogenase subunit GcvPB n=1 Tax=Staphylococcus hominis TaxID=1290 RepID=UPI0030C0C2FD
MTVSKSSPLIFERSREGRYAYSLPQSDIKTDSVERILDDKFIRKNKAEFPEVAELDLVRHYTELSNKNFGVDSGFYPLGSCTMKYNPKINEKVARISGFAESHPLQEEEQIQGSLEIIYSLQEELKEITGMDEVTLQPAAGAHGEWTALMIFKAYHIKNNGEGHRNEVIVPDSAHGTNPASASFAGFKSVTVKSNERGEVDIEDLKRVVNENTAAIMLTNPNTLGIFEKNIMEIREIVHEAGGLLYYDGANLNAIMDKVRPGDMGFDAVHLNLHKTFTGPHGGGGPGSGPVGVKKELASYLPKPMVIKDGDTFKYDNDIENSIGRVKPFYGNFGIYLRAYTYIRTMGAKGLKEVSEAAVLNANYIKARLKDRYEIPYEQYCKHEFVLSGSKQKEYGVRTLDMAKRLLDFGVHPPTIYFPLNVEEGMMIEPTETESKETLDYFIDAMLQIADEVESNPDNVLEAPHTTIIDRLDETTAARKPILKFEDLHQEKL